MIEPAQSEAELLRQLYEKDVAAGQLRIWWLGQSGYLIKSRSGLLAVDLYLSEHLTQKYESSERPHVRMTRSPVRGHSLRKVDLVLASHRHSDHLDPGTLPGLLEASPAATLVIPEAIRDHVLGLGIAADRLLGIDAGQTIERAGFRVTAVPSAHETVEIDAQGHHRYLGFVIECDRLSLYHSGDSCVYDGLAERLEGLDLDVMFLPINGRDPARGVPGNMTAAEAVDLARRVRPRYVVPHHYNMFTFNSASVEDFRSEANRLPEGVSARVLECAEAWEIRL